MASNVISSSNTIPGAFGQRRVAGTPNAGTSEVNTLTIGGTPSGGTFRLAWAGNATQPITWVNDNAALLAAINAALDAAVGAGAIVATAGTLTAGVGTILLTFSGPFARMATSTISVNANNLTGTSPTLGIVKTTPGVTATLRGAPKGAIALDTTTPKVFQNSGSETAPVAAVVGSQS